MNVDRQEHTCMITGVWSTLCLRATLFNICVILISLLLQIHTSHTYKYQVDKIVSHYLIIGKNSLFTIQRLQHRL